MYRTFSGAYMASILVHSLCTVMLSVYMYDHHRGWVPYFWGGGGGGGWEIAFTAAI